MFWEKKKKISNKDNPVTAPESSSVCWGWWRRGRRDALSSLADCTTQWEEAGGGWMGGGSSWVQCVQPAESLCCIEAATAANGNRPVEVRGRCDHGTRVHSKFNRHCLFCIRYMIYKLNFNCFLFAFHALFIFQWILITSASVALRQ